MATKAFKSRKGQSVANIVLPETMNPSEDHTAVFLKVAAPPAQRLALVTTTEAQLADIGRLIASSLAPLVQPGEAPVLISIGGTYKSGQGIVPEAIRETLLGTETVLHGSRHQAEVWKNESGGAGIEVSLVNASQQDPVPFLRQPHQPGIIFIQNDVRHDVKTGFEITIESPESSLAKRAPLSGMDDKFAAEAGNPWLRYVEIKASEPRLLLQSSFRQGLQQIAETFKAAPAAAKTPEAVKPTAPQPPKL